MERTVGHLVMPRRPGFGNGRQFGVGVDVAGASAVAELTEVVRQSLGGLLVGIGLKGIGMATAASRTIGRKLPRRLVRVGRMARRAAGRAFVIARVFSGRVREGHHRPVRVVMAGGAVERGRHVVGDFAGGGWVANGGIDQVLEACIFPDNSTIDSWGLFYHSANIIRGIDLSTVLRYSNPYATKKGE